MSRPALQVVKNPDDYDPELMDQVRAHVALQRSITTRWNARRDRLLARVRATSNTPGYDIGSVHDIIAPREEHKAACKAIHDAVGAGCADVALLQEYACAAAAVERSTAKTAFASLLHDGIIDLSSSYQVSPGPNYESWSPPSPEI